MLIKKFPKIELYCKILLLLEDEVHKLYL